MQVSVVFESMFGNTESVARAVAEGLRAGGARVDVRRAGSVDSDLLRGYDLLVLAAPTHALSLSRPASRAEAVGRGADPARASSGLREWMADLDRGEHAPAVAVCDTRARVTRHWPGSAARRMSRTMRAKGFVVDRPTSFYVDDVTGPVLAGELDRARAWGRRLAAGSGPEEH